MRLLYVVLVYVVFHSRVVAQDHDRMTQLSASRANQLVRAANREGEFFLSFKSVTELADSSAEQLVRFKGNALCLDGLMTLSPGTALILRQSNARWLSLSGVRDLSLDSAEALAGFEGEGLVLNGLAELSTPAAKALAKSKCTKLVFRGILSLPADQASALAQYEGSVRMDRVSTLADDAAKAIADSKGLWYFEGLTELSEKAGRDLEGSLRVAVLPVKFSQRRMAAQRAAQEAAEAAQKAAEAAQKAAQEQAMKDKRLWFSVCSRCGKPRQGWGPDGRMWMGRDTDPYSNCGLSCGQGSPPCPGPMIFTPMN